MAPKSKSAAVKKKIDKTVGKKLVEEKTEKKTPPATKVTKKAAPAQKVTAKASTVSPAKKAVAKMERTRVEPEKKALSKKTKKPLVSQIDFASVLLDTCQTLIMCMNSEWEEVADKKTGTYKIVNTSNFCPAAGVLDLLPEEARLPLMQMAGMYSRYLEQHSLEEVDYEDDADEEEDTEEEEEDNDAERNAAIMEEFAKDLQADEDHSEDFLFGGVMKIEHFYQFKSFFTESEAAELVKSHTQGGKLDQALKGAIDAVDTDDEDFEMAEDADDDDDDEDDEDEAADEVVVNWKAD